MDKPTNDEPNDFESGVSELLALKRWETGKCRPDAILSARISKAQVILEIEKLLATEFSGDTEHFTDAAAIFEQMPITLCESTTSEVQRGLEYDFVDLARMAMHDLFNSDNRVR